MKDIPHNLCKEISELSNGVCLLGFSRGKDSIAAWIILKKYFNRIIPFHVCSIPHLSFVDESLKYYEEYFNTPIERFLSGEITKALNFLWYQPIEDEGEIDSLELWEYDNHNICDILRKKHDLPSVWCAYGINASDSIDRRIYVNKYKGKIESRKSFYPCFDYKKTQILNIIKENNILLPKDYLISNRSLAGIPGIRHLEGIKEKFPNDFEKIKLWFPLIEVQIARNKFRESNSLTI